MHNNIMVAGLRDHPPMLATRRYAQWQSRFMRYVDTKPNGEALRKCILQAKPITPPSESAFEEYSDPEQAQKDKEMQKNLALIAKETIGSQIVQQTGIQYFNCKEFGHFAKKCRKPKRTKDYTYDVSIARNLDILLRELTGNQKAKRLQLIHRRRHKQELEAHYSFMAKIQEVLPADSGSDVEPLEKVQYDVEHNVFINERQHSEQPEPINNTYVVEKVDSNVIPDSSDMCDNDNQADQNAKECDDERVVLATLIANLQLDTEENKKIQKQLKKTNTSLAQELKECKSTLEETNRTLGEYNRTRDRYLVALHDKEVELAKYKTFKDHTIENDTLERKLKETLGLLAQKKHDIKEGLKIKAYEISVVKEKNDELVKQSLFTKSSYEGLLKEKNKVIKDLKLKEGHDLDKLIAKAQSKKPCLYEIPYVKDDLANIFAPDRVETLTLEQESRSKLNKDKLNHTTTKAKQSL
ncbi:integrase, catalytic region, zinc finger, CCHC-type containing protein [Tanacetum coccineum]